MRVDLLVHCKHGTTREFRPRPSYDGLGIVWLHVYQNALGKQESRGSDKDQEKKGGKWKSGNMIDRDLYAQLNKMGRKDGITYVKSTPTSSNLD